MLLVGQDVVEVLTLTLVQRISECYLEIVLQGVVLNHHLRNKIGGANLRQNIFGWGGLGRRD